MLCQVCVNLENIFKIRWDQEEVVFRVIYATQRIAKEGVSRQLYANLENINQNSLSSGEDVFIVLLTHHK